MADEQINKHPPKKLFRWWKVFLIPLAFPIVVVAMLVVSLMTIGALAYAPIYTITYRRRLRLQGRLTSWRDIRPRLQQGEGTLLVIAGPKGCGGVWWSPDNIDGLYPNCPLPTALDVFQTGEGFLRLLGDESVRDWVERELISDLKKASYVVRARRHFLDANLPDRRVLAVPFDALPAHIDRP